MMLDIDITVAETINGVAFSLISMVNLNSMLVIKSRLMKVTERDGFHVN